MSTQDATAEALELFEALKPKQKALLAAYIESGGSVTNACAAVGIDRICWYRWKGYGESSVGDPAFQAVLPIAEDLATQRLVDAAVQRAVEGIEREVGWYQGVAGGKERLYSDQLLVELLRAKRPEFSRRLHVDLQGEVGVMKVPEKAEPEQWAAAAKEYQRRLMAGEVESDENGGEE